MRFCKRPFENFEMNGNFEVFTCCPNYFKENQILGNLLQDSPENIWNSEVAQNLRQHILKGDFSLCNTGRCCNYPTLEDVSEEELKKYSAICTKKPKYVWLYYDVICNAKCTMCRDDFYNNYEEKTEFLNKIAEEKILPLLKDAEMVYLNGAGEVFYSIPTQYLIKRANELYPKLKYDLVSNGFLCNKENIEKLGLRNKIDKLTISIHAATEETHKKIFRTGSLQTILNNLKEIKEMKDNGEIPFIQLIFVITSMNYKEIPDFVKLAQDLNMVAVFCDYVAYDYTEMGRNGKEYNIIKPEHPLHKDLLEVLKSEELNDKQHCFLNPLIQSLRDKALSESGQ